MFNMQFGQIVFDNSDVMTPVDHSGGEKRRPQTQKIIAGQQTPPSE
jgi:hypothetical protein